MNKTIVTWSPRKVVTGINETLALWSRVGPNLVSTVSIKDRAISSKLSVQLCTDEIQINSFMMSTQLCYNKAANNSWLGLHSFSSQICWPLRLQRDIQKTELGLIVAQRPHISTAPIAAVHAFDVRLHTSAASSPFQPRLKIPTGQPKTDI